MSTFVVHHTEVLLQTALSPPKGSNASSPGPGDRAAPSPRTQKLHSLLVSFKPPINPSLIHETLLVLQNDSEDFNAHGALDNEEKNLRTAAVGAVVTWIYGQILDMCLQQATEADTEANWWAELERSRQKLAWYLLETSPIRLKRVFETVVTVLRSKDMAITPLAFTPNSLRQLFPTTARPSRLATAFFPHLSHQSRVIFRSPFELTRQECHSRRQALESIRDDWAERLGRLATHRDQLQDALLDLERGTDNQGLASFVGMIQQVVDDSAPPSTGGDEQALVAGLSDITFEKLPQASSIYNVGISAFRRPSRLTRLWPRLVLIPPITFVLFKVVYGSRRNIAEHLAQAAETVLGFWRGYLVQPVRDILDTIRTGGEEGARIVSQEGVKADMESLERMALALSREKYNFSPAELEGLSLQIRRGDLTPVLKVYEEDLKSPLRSAVAGSLIRSLLIQVQKMKVDVDVALSGIDKLLKSQELTFAFVGVAPALAIVYAAVGWVRNIWSTGRGKGRYGGRGRREAVWLSMRRVERLLALSATHSSSEAEQVLTHSQSQSLSSLDQGLILLSVAQLRTYAQTYLPARSRLREEFLVDVSDLEDPNLGRGEKKEIVKRMWRSWSTVLGWSSIGGN